MQVIWQEDGGYFRAKRFHSETGAAFNVYPSSEFEVIGNMYENPE